MIISPHTYLSKKLLLNVAFFAAVLNHEEKYVQTEPHSLVHPSTEENKIAFEPLKFFAVAVC